MKRNRKSGYTPPTPRLSADEIAYYRLGDKLIGDVTTRPHLWREQDIIEHWHLAQHLGKLHGTTLEIHRRYLESCWDEYTLSVGDEHACPDCGNYLHPDTGICESCESGHWLFG